MRLFTGLSFPAPITQKLATLRGSLPSLVWSEPQDYHLTLCFLGTITDYDLIHDLDLALSHIKIRPFPLTIENINYFKSASGILTFWAGIQPSEALNHLQGKIRQTVQSLKIPIQKRKFLPHITLGKGTGLQDEQIGKWLYHYNLFKTEPFQITHFSLFSAYPNKAGHCYEIEENYPLR